MSRNPCTTRPAAVHEINRRLRRTALGVLSKLRMGFPGFLSEAPCWRQRLYSAVSLFGEQSHWATVNACFQVSSFRPIRIQRGTSASKYRDDSIGPTSSAPGHPNSTRISSVCFLASSSSPQIIIGGVSSSNSGSTIWTFETVLKHFHDPRARERRLHPFA